MANTKPYALIFTYTFDNDCAVYLFETMEAAVKSLVNMYNEEMRIDNENGWNTYGEINTEEGWAKITNVFNDRDDVTKIVIGSVYE